MKSCLLICISLLFCLTNINAQELLTPLNSGKPVEQGTLEEPIVLKNAVGDLFLVYVKEGGLLAQRSPDQGQSFSHITIDLKGRVLANFRSLTLHERSYEDWVVFFMAEEGSNQGIYALECDEAGGLHLAYEGALDDAGLNGDIATYEIHPDRRSGFYVVYNKGGMLGFRFIEHGGVVHEPVAVSEAGEQVEEFEWKEHISTGILSHYGVYLIKQGALQKLILYEVAGNSVTSRLELANAAVASPLAYQIKKTSDGNIYCVYKQGTLLYAVKALKGAITSINNGKPLNEDKGSIVSFESFVSEDTLQVVMLASQSGIQNVYAATIATAGNVNFSFNGQPLNKGAVQGAFKLYNYGKGNALLGFMEAGGSGNFLKVYKKDKPIKQWQDISYEIMGLDNAVDFTFGKLSTGEVIVEILQKQETQYRESFYAITDMHNERSKCIYTTIIEISGGSSTGSFTGDTFIRKKGNSFYCLYPLKQQMQIAYSVIPLAQSAEYTPCFIQSDGENISLSLLPQPKPAPKGALWTYGSVNNNDAGLCRVYLWEDSANGGYKVEVQRYEYEVPVYWDGAYQGDSDEYMRFFYLKAAEEKEIWVEVWDGEERVGVYKNIISSHLKESVFKKDTVLKKSLATKGLSFGEGGGLGDFTIVDRGTGLPIVQVTENGYDDISALMDAGVVVWRGYDGHDDEICLWQDGITTQLTNDDYDDYNPQINNGVVVWEHYDGNDDEIYLWRDGITSPLTNNNYDDRYPQIDNDVVVWAHYDGNDYEIYLWRDGITTPLTNNNYDDHNPQIDSGEVVWYGYDSEGHDTEIYLWSEGLDIPIQLTNNDNPDDTPVIDAGEVVWRGKEGYYYEIFIWKDGVKTNLSNNKYFNLNPQINNGIVVWCAYENMVPYKDKEIFIWRNGVITKLTNDEYDDSAPQIDAGVIIWQFSWTYESEIYLWHEGVKTILTNNNNEDSSPLIDSGVVVWYGSDGNDTEIYLFSFETAPPEITLDIKDINNNTIYTWTKNSPVTVTASAIDISDNAYYNIPVGVDGSTWNWWTEGIEVKSGTGNNPAIISENGETTVFFSVKDKLGNEATASTVVRIDTETPLLNLSPVPSGYVNHDVMVNINPTDTLSGITISNDTIESWATLAGAGEQVHKYGQEALSVDITWPGETHVYFRVRDNAGNEIVEGCKVYIDKTLPVISYSRTPSQPWTNAFSVSLVVTGTTDEGGSLLVSNSLYYETNGAVTTQLTQLMVGTPITITAEGLTTVYFSVKDGAGNITTETVPVGIDRQPPIITVADIPWTKEDVAVTAIAADLAGLSGIDPASFMAVKDWYGQTTNIYGSNTVSSFKDGITTVTFTVKDNAGNTSAAVSCLVHIDRIPPQVTKPAGLLTVGTKDWTNAFTLAAAASDGTGDVSGIDQSSWEWSANGTTWQGGKDAETGAEGAKTLYYRVKDAAGNPSSASGTGFEINVDRTGPVISIAQGGTGGSTITASAADAGVGLSTASSWEWRQGSEPWQSGKVAVLVGSGVQTVTFRVADRLGNQTEKSFTVVIDSEPPVITPAVVTSGVEFTAWTGQRSVYVGAAVSDAESGVNPAKLQVSLDDGANFLAWDGNPVEVTATEGSALKLGIVFKATDLAGNEASVRVELWLDAQAPTVTPQILTAGVLPGQWTNKTVAVGASGSDGAGSGLSGGSWQYSLNGTSWISGQEATVAQEGMRRVWFRVSDTVGNTGQGFVWVYMDLSGPAVSGLVAQTCTNGGSTLKVTALAGTDILSGADQATWAYSFNDDTGFTGLPFSASSGGVLNTSGLADGSHVLNVVVDDAVGNRGTGHFTFSVDRSGPKITSLIVRDSAGVVEEGKYTQYNLVTVEVQAIDENPDGSQGLVAGVEYVLTTEWTATPDFTGALSSTSLTFTLYGLNQGVNYLYVRAIDAGGNASLASVRQVLCDSDIPGAPLVKGLTHARAEDEEDAVSLGTAEFELYPSLSGVGGVAGFNYGLFKGSTGDPVKSGFTAERRLVFTALADNAEHEFYELRVTAVGANGKQSGPSTYKFRVDTKPPLNLKVHAVPHSNPDVYYKSTESLFLWNRPLDMTGVKSYYYRLFLNEPALPATGEEAKTYNLTGWNPTQDEEVPADAALFSSNEYGEIWFAVCAEDFAGNREFSKVSIRFDRAPPWLGDKLEPDAALGVTAFAEEKRVEISYAPAFDLGSGVLLLEAALSIVGQDGTPEQQTQWKTLDQAENITTYAGLLADTTYLVTIKVTDNAGNQTQYVKAFNLEQGEIDLGDIALPFAVLVHGCEVYGLKSSDALKTKAWLKLPESLQAREVEQGSGQEAAVSEVELGNIQFEGEEFVSGRVPVGRTFILNVAGFEVRAEGLSISKDAGLVLTSVDYAYTPAGETEPRAFSYTGVGLSSPPRIVFNQTGSDVQAGAFSVQSVYEEEGQTLSGWLFSGVNATLFKGSHWIAAQAELATQAINAYTVDGQGLQSFGLEITELKLTSRAGVYEGGVAEEFYLEQGQNIYRVLQALVRGNKLIVLDARLVFAQGVAAGEVSIANFSIDSNGQIQEEAGFALTGLDYFTDANGNTYVVEDAGFVGNTLVVSGHYEYGDGQSVAYDGLIITTNGPDLEQGASISYFQAVVHGYTVVSSSARLNSQGVLLNTARITGFVFGQGGYEPQLEHLGLKLPGYEVYEAGWTQGSFAMTTEYGRPLLVLGLSLTKDGLFAVSTAVPLPEVLGDVTVSFTGLQLLSNGMVGVSAPLDEAVDFMLAGFNCTGEGAVFDGKLVNFSTVTVDLGLEAYGGQASFAGFSVNGSGLVTGGESAEGVGVSMHGWDFSLSALWLGTAGISGRAETILPYAFGSRSIVFQEFRLVVGGNFISGTADESFYVRIGGWLTLLSQISLNQGLLVAGSGEVELYSMMGSGKLAIPDVALNSDGTIDASCGTGSTPVSFLAVNGFEADLESYTFTERGLVASGSVHFPRGLGNAQAVYTGNEILLDADGVISTDKIPGPVSYSVAGFDVQARDLYFSREGLIVEHNTLTVRILGVNVSMELPKIQFYADGQIKVAGLSFEGFNLPLFGGKVGVTEILLSGKGLNLKAFVTLPACLGGYSIYFDKLTLYPNGAVSTDAAIREFPFKLGDFEFILRNILLDEDGLSIGEGLIILPAVLDNKRIYFEHFRIKADGSFELGSMGLDPFELFGFIFEVNHLGIEDGIISFAGGITLPASFPAGLGGERLAIESFRMTTQGEVLEFAAYLDREFQFELFPGWTVKVNRLGVTKLGDHFYLALEKASLGFPDWIPAQEVAITGVRLDPVTGEFLFDAISITGVNVPLLGIAFYLDEIMISSAGDFTFKGQATLPAGFPEPFAGKTLKVSVFEIHSGGSVGDVGGGVAGINGNLFGSSFYVSNAALELVKAGDAFTVSVQGDLQFGSVFPEGIAGKTIKIGSLKIKSDNNGVSIEEFAAGATGLSIDLLGFTRVENASVSVAKSTATGELEVGVTGEIVLPQTLPEALAGQKVTIEAFRMTIGGEILEFKAGFVITEEKALFPGINLRSGKVTVELKDGDICYDIKGVLVLTSQFPPGLAGTECEIKTLVFTAASGLKEIDVEVKFPDTKLFGTLLVKGGVLELQKKGINDLLLSLHGAVVLPDFFPEGLAGLEVEIGSFTMNTRGEIITLDILLANASVDLFGVLKLQGFDLRATNKGNDELIFTATNGNIILPEGLPGDLSGLMLAVNKLELSSKDGLTKLDAGIQGSIDFPLFAGIVATVGGLSLSESGFSMYGSVKFPATFPGGLAGLEILLTHLKMGWDGELKEIEAGINYLTLDLAGFTAEIKYLHFDTKGIGIQSCDLILPPCLGARRIGFKNAGFDYDGKFYGQIVAPALDFTICGFGFRLEGPSFDINDGEIRFSKVSLNLPPFIGGALSLNQVSIGPEGIIIRGGSIRLPSFELAGGLGFRGIMIDFTVDKNQYRVEGAGGISIPGLGGFDAEIVFRNVSSEYPWGIEKIFFEYTVMGVGLPLGSSGLFLNKIRGGIAFGPPNEIPSKVRNMFGSGCRLQLGLTVADITGGNIFKGDVDMWVDVYNWSWAFKGEVSILHGFVKAEVIAALTQKGFYADLEIELMFVRGGVTVWVFPHDGRTMVSGRGWVQFGLRKHFFLCIKFEILGWKVHEGILPWDIWLPRICAEFGLFKNGKEGFKGYVDVPFLGEVGVFVGKSDFSIGSVSKYELYDPYASDSRNLRTVAELASDATPKAAGAKPKETGRDARAFALDKIQGPAVTDSKHFMVPGKRGGKVFAPRLLKSEAKQGMRTLSKGTSALGEGITLNEAPDPTAVVERLVFAIIYAEGDPQVAAISPGGQKYYPGDGKVLVERVEHGMIMVVLNPEAGEWKVEVSNLFNRDAYHIEVLGVTKAPVISVETPAYNSQAAGASFEVKGGAQVFSENEAVVNVYLSAEKDSFLGDPAGTVPLGADGRFSTVINTSGLADGEYYVYAGVNEGEDGIEKRAYAPGSIMVRNTSPLTAVTGFKVGDNGEGGLDVVFSDPNGERAKGFRLYIEHLNADGSVAGVEKLWLGYVTAATVPGFAEGDRLKVSVAPTDQANREGARSNTVLVTIGELKEEKNVFTIAAPDKLKVAAGASVEGSITYTVANPVTTGTGYDCLEARVVTLPEGISVSFKDRVWDLTKSSGSIAFVAGADQAASPGSYEVQVEFSSMGNSEIKKLISFAIDVEYAQFEVYQVLPPHDWNVLDQAEIEILGRNFYAGTRVYLAGQELAVSFIDAATLKALVPAGMPGLKGGINILKVAGPGGYEQEYELEADAPYYVLRGFKTYAKMNRGAEGYFPFSIQGFDRFTGSVSFSIQNTDPGISVSLDRSVISSGEPATAEVTVAADAALGAHAFSLATQDGVTLEFTVDVVEGEIDPAIASFSRLSCFVGEEVTIYGYGFGLSGVVRLGGVELPAVSYSADAITVRITAEAHTGEVTVERDGNLSNARILYIKEHGFNIYASQDEVRLAPAEQTVVDVNVSGFALSVTLEAHSNTEGITASITPSSVKPNAMAKLTIAAASNVAGGTYTVEISGRSEDLTTAISIKVLVGAAFEITTLELPVCMEDTSYRAELVTINGQGTVLFALEKGDLPLGLSLSERGVIQGRSAELGVKTFTVKATDAKARSASKELTIRVAENSWAFDLMDAGRSLYNPVRSPADARVAWKSRDYLGAKEILTGRKRVFVLGDNGVLGLDKDSGLALYEYKGGFQQWAYASETLFLLDRQNVLYAVDAAAGNLKWQREEAEFFTTDGLRLYVRQGSKILVLDAAQGSLLNEIQAGLDEQSLYLFISNDLYRVSGNSLYKLDTAQGVWQSVYTAEARIMDAAFQGDELALLCEGGRLLILNLGFSVQRSMESGMPGARIVMGAEKILLASEAETVCYRRNDLARLYVLRGGQSWGLALEKLFTINEYGVAGYNIYSGSEIWRSDYAARDLAIAGECVYVLSGFGGVTAYNGPDNLLPPDTQIVLTPAEPDGENGFYTVIPAVEIKAADKESYVSGVWYRLNSNEWQGYGGPFALQEGQSSIVAYALDSRGLRSADVIRNVLVDAGKPVSTISITGQEKNPGFYETAVSIELKAEDNISGLEYIEYQLNGGGFKHYDGVISLGAEGAYRLEYRAKDFAGNTEDMHVFSFMIDFTLPQAGAETYIEPGLGVVYLGAFDQVSGVARIEYRVDGGAVYVYSEPVVLTVSGVHTVEYRAFDLAGWTSEWQSVQVTVRSIQEYEWVEGLKYAYPLPQRKVVRNVKTGETMFEPDRGKNNRIRALPDYLAGADFIKCMYEDKHFTGDKFLWFTAGVECDVYIMKHRESGARLAGWELVEKGFQVEPVHYYEGGADIYRKHFKQGELVVVPGAAIKSDKGYGNLVFVQAAGTTQVKIINPRPETELAPLDKLRFQGIVPASGDKSLLWQVQYGQGHWQDLGTALSGELTLPYTADRLSLQLKLTVTMKTSGQVLTATAGYVIINRAKIELLNPGPGTELARGEELVLDYRVYGLKGEELDPGAVRFYASWDGKQWQECTGNVLKAPDKQGELRLKGVIGLGDTHTKEVFYRFRVVKEYRGINIIFGRKSLRSAYSLGQTLGLHENGMMYGFNLDHSSNIGSFWLCKPRHISQRVFYIALQNDGQFTCYTGKGRFRVTLTLGPVDKKQDTFVRINGRRINIENRHGIALFKVIKDVEITDGILSIQGKPGLGLVSLEVEKKMPGDTGPSMEKVERVADVIIRLIHHDHQDKHDGHGQPDRDDDNHGRDKGGRRQ